MKIKELLSDPTKWTQRVLARNEDRLEVVSDSNDAICWCLMGAFIKCYPDKDISSDEWQKLSIACDRQVTIWNDDVERTFDEIKELVERLDL